MYEKAPHITSHLQIILRSATDEDYYIPAALIDSCKVIDVKITKNLCELINCTSTKEHGLCTPLDQTSYYYLGDNEFDLQCQPACFNLIDKKNHPKETEVKPDMFGVNYFEDNCMILPPITTYLEKPEIRSDTYYEHRLNDMPTGFSREYDEKSDVGFKYTMNETYCNYFDEILLDTGNCGQKWNAIISDYLGLSFVKQINSAIKVVFTNKPFDVPSNLPPKPTNIPEKFTLQGWKKNIDSSFQIPDLINTNPKKITNITHFRHKFEHAYQNAPKSDSSKVEIDWVDKLTNLFQDSLNDVNFLEKMILILEGQHLTDVTLSAIKSFCLQYIEKLGPILGKELLLLTEEIGSKILSESLSVVCINTAIKFSLSMVTKSAIFLAKFTVAAASVVGWVLFIGIFIDMIFQFWDPFGYKNMLPSESLEMLMKNGELALRNQLDTDIPNFTFEMLYMKILTPDEILQININSFKEVTIYLNALVVNSDGNFIDRGEIITINGNENDLNKALIRNNAKKVRFNLKNYNQYNENFLKQAKLNNNLINLSLASGFISILLYILQINILAFIFIIITIFIFILARIDLYSCNIIKALNEIKFNF